MERFGAYGVSPRRGGDEALETEQDLSRLTPTAFAPMGGTQTGFSQSMGQPLLGSAFSYDSAAAAAFAPLAPKPPPPGLAAAAIETAASSTLPGHVCRQTMI
jgi:hypothetical protein